MDMMEQERIGMFGGSFDPPHIGHKRLARYAADKLSLTKLYIIPAASPPHKENAGLSAARERLALCERAFTGDARFCVSDLELQRKGKSYTADTLFALRELHPAAALFLLMGADMYASFHTWMRYTEILGVCTLCVAAREKSELPQNRKLDAAQHKKVLLLPMESFPLSSTQIREKVRSAADYSAYVTPETAQYIEERGLYRAKS